MLSIKANDTLAYIVSNNHKTAEIFSAHGMDHCCRGQQTIEVAARQLNYTETQTKQLLNTLKKCSLQKKNIPDFETWNINTLVDYIEKRHHSYAEQSIAPLQSYLDRVALVHGEAHPELAQIAALFKQASGELVIHMKQEELTLFPLLRKISRSEHELSNNQINRLQEKITALQEDHDFEGESFRKVRALSNNYTTSEDACPTYRLTYQRLRDFEADLHFHVHLENNILFKKAQNRLATKMH